MSDDDLLIQRAQEAISRFPRTPLNPNGRFKASDEMFMLAVAQFLFSADGRWNDDIGHRMHVELEEYALLYDYLYTEVAAWGLMSGEHNIEVEEGFVYANGYHLFYTDDFTYDLFTYWVGQYDARYASFVESFVTNKRIIDRCIAEGIDVQLVGALTT